MLDQLAALKASRNWRQVAAIISRCGGVSKSASWWLQIAAGNKRARREDINAVRACFPGLELIPPSADELLDAYGVERAIVADENPDAALLVKTGGANVTRVTVNITDNPVYGSTKSFVTVGNKRENRRPSASLCFMSDFASIASDSLSTQKGKTGNLAIISAAVLAARQALDATPTEAEVAGWMRTL